MFDTVRYIYLKCRDMTEKLLKATLNPNSHTHTHVFDTVRYLYLILLDTSV